MIYQEKLTIEHQFSFLLAICHKRVTQFDECQRNYSKLERVFDQRKGYNAANCIF